MRNPEAELVRFRASLNPRPSSFAKATEDRQRYSPRTYNNQWSGMADLNCQSHEPESCALPIRPIPEYLVQGERYARTLSR